MEYLAYIVIGFTAIQLLVSLVNFIFRQNMPKAQEYKELVSILIPARNEEKNITHLLTDLQHQDYENIEIIVFDDQSADSTNAIVRHFVETDNRIKLIASEGLPEGWLGKNYACHSLSQKANGEFLLFLDADVRINNDIINRTIHQVKKYQLSLLSIFPKQIMKTLGEHFTVPIMNYILLTLLPLVLVRKSDFISLSAANGQFMFFRTDIYNRMIPHQKVKNNKVEDIEIARYYKKNKMKIACLASSTYISSRMYNQYSDAINGFSKNVTMFFGNSFMFSILFWSVTIFGFIPILLIYKAFGLVLYMVAISVIRILVSLTSNQSVLKNLLLHFVQQFSLGVIIFKSIQHKLKKQYIWKGRNIS